MAWATVLFFGAGFIVLAMRLWRQAPHQPAFHARNHPHTPARAIRPVRRVRLDNRP